MKRDSQRPNGPDTRQNVVIENIEEMRLQQGIDDVDLWQQIAKLQAGDFVKLTLVASTQSSETLAVRITSIRGSTYRGKLVDKPASTGLSDLKPGSPLVFKASHIHSVVQEQ